MSMLDYSEVLPRKIILHDGEPWEVLDAHVFRKQMRKPVNATKLKNLITGRVIEISFQQSDKVEEAEVTTRNIKYLFTNRGEYWFCDPENPRDRFALPAEQVEGDIQWVKANSVIEARVFDEKIIGLRLPIKVDLKVSEAAPAVRGDTSGKATKIVVLETGAKIAVPLFINQGDVLRINTETSAYVERVEKA